MRSRGSGERRYRPELAEGVAELGADAVDGLLEPDGLELLRAEILDDRQQELDAVVVGGQPLLFEEVAELRHVVGVDAEDAQGLQQVRCASAAATPSGSASCAALEAHVHNP